MGLGADDVGDEEAERAGGEFSAGDLALEGPEMGVDVEDTLPEEVREDGAEAVAFDVVGEVGAEKTVDDAGVGGADARGEGEGATDLDGVGGGGGEEVGNPVEEAVAVTDEGQEITNDGEAVGAVVGRRWAAAEVGEEEDGDREGEG